MNNYTNQLRLHNLKATPQRLAIADALHMHGHITVESLYEMMLKKFSSISLATIYKNMNLMIENSFVEEIKLPDTKSVYELKKASHSHLLCKACGEVEDVTIDLSSAMEDASNRSDFKIDSTALTFVGLCQKCS